MPYLRRRRWKGRTASGASSVGRIELCFFKEPTRQSRAENTREFTRPPHPTRWSDLGMFEPPRLRCPVVLVVAVLLAGPLNAKAEGRKRQRFGKGRYERQGEPCLDAGLLLGEQGCQPFERQRFPADLALAETPVAVDAIQRADDRVEQGDARFGAVLLRSDIEEC